MKHGLKAHPSNRFLIFEVSTPCHENTISSSASKHTGATHYKGTFKSESLTSCTPRTSSMASFFALKTLASSSIPPRALRSTISSSATWACRFFNTTNAFREYDDDGGDDREFDFERSSARSLTPSFFPGARLLSTSSLT